MNDKGKLFVDGRLHTAAVIPGGHNVGGVASALGNSSPFQTRLACVSLNMTDRTLFISFSAEEIKTLRVRLSSTWRIQGERKYGGADEFNFREYPWVARHNGNDQSRRLVKKLLETLYDLGWVLQAAIDISKKHVGKALSGLPKFRPL
ncbi:hypothetical protein SLS53_002385 [Cytospora paraplurivora]|uniref:Uncharacterized protein n=1 Tax=Cytospora paraplurivora TaxID=2898453 RepID=A0AAN9UEI2_9PEZI